MTILTRDKDIYGKWGSSWMESSANELASVMREVTDIAFSFENGNVYLWDTSVQTGQPGNFAVISDYADVELQIWSKPAQMRSGFAPSPFGDADNAHLPFKRESVDE